MEGHGDEAYLAWRIFQAIEKLSDGLFDRYHDAFVDFHLEEEENRRRENFFFQGQRRVNPEKTEFPPPFPWESEG